MFACYTHERTNPHPPHTPGVFLARTKRAKDFSAETPFLSAFGTKISFGENTCLMCAHTVDAVDNPAVKTLYTSESTKKDHTI